jgi:hypothetical protein
MRSGPPVEAGVQTDGLRHVREPRASVHQRLLRSVEIVQEPVGHRLVHQRPQPLGGHELWRMGRQHEEAESFGQRRTSLLVRQPDRRPTHYVLVPARSDPLAELA